MHELDEFVAEYGFDNNTGIDDLKIAMNVARIRKNKEIKNGNTLRNDREHQATL